MRKITSKKKDYYYCNLQNYNKPWLIGPQGLSNNQNYINSYINKPNQKQIETIKNNTYKILQKRNIKPGVYKNGINTIKVFNIDPIKRICNVYYNTKFNRIKGVNTWDLFFLVDYLIDNNYKCIST